MTAPDARKKLDDESKKASTSAKKASTGAATTGGGTGIALPTLDWAHMSIGGKVFVCALAAFAIIVAVEFIARAIYHNNRADAYAKA